MAQKGIKTKPSNKILILKYWKFKNIKNPSDTLFQGSLKRYDDFNDIYLKAIVFKTGVIHFHSPTNSPEVELKHNELKELLDLIELKNVKTAKSKGGTYVTKIINCGISK